MSGKSGWFMGEKMKEAGWASFFCEAPLSLGIHSNNLSITSARVIHSSLYDVAKVRNYFVSKKKNPIKILYLFII